MESGGYDDIRIIGWKGVLCGEEGVTNNPSEENEDVLWLVFRMEGLFGFDVTRIVWFECRGQWPMIDQIKSEQLGEACPTQITKLHKLLVTYSGNTIRQRTSEYSS